MTTSSPGARLPINSFRWAWASSTVIVADMDGCPFGRRDTVRRAPLMILPRTRRVPRRLLLSVRQVNIVDAVTDERAVAPEPGVVVLVPPRFLAPVLGPL